MRDPCEDEGKNESVSGGAKEQLSRRSFLTTSILGAAVAGAGLACSRSEAAGTAPPGGYGAGHWWMRRPGYVPKAYAHYQDYPNGQQRCGGCVHFLGPNACGIVKGPISPDGWCQYFQPGG